MFEFVLLDINHDVLIERYAEIDTFSQGRLPDRPLGLTSRNMGKNDLWIAATASVAEAVLLTTDSDFDHLTGTLLRLEKIVLQASLACCQARKGQGAINFGTIFSHNPFSTFPSYLCFYPCADPIGLKC